jgi:hypothetical protein
MRSRAKTLNRKSKVRRQGDPIPWKYCLLTLLCGLLLVAGFFWAARQHFSSMDYGMKNAKLRKQIEEITSENRRLQLTKEIALSPSEIKKAAKKLGLTAMTARNIEVLEPKNTVEKEFEKTETKKEDKVEDSKSELKKEKESDSKKINTNKADKEEKQAQELQDKNKADNQTERKSKNNKTGIQVTKK